MDKKMVKRWFNGMYGKLPPERQLEELEKMKAYLDELADEKKESFAKTQTCCRKCGKYSLTNEFVSKTKLATRTTNNPANNESRKAEYSVETYTCPKCGQTYIFDSKFVRFIE